MHTVSSLGRQTSPSPDLSDNDIDTPTTTPTGQEPAQLPQITEKSFEKPRKSYWKKKILRKRKGPLLGKYNPSLKLENSGSVARDHLASERTYLAYVRTSLTISSTGVALVQLFTIASTTNKTVERYSRPLGATIIIIGWLTLLMGVVRYFTIQYALLNGDFPVARVTTAALSLALLVIVLVVFGVLVAVKTTT
ncbi:hypothetical protein C8Q75DRAFT_794618 [Abortiporus biennis]|nr:hypothetical protein C8Q75DRAFT_794618 [Abortiporus biennis]